MKLVKVGALWCPSCIIIDDMLDKLKEEYELEIIEYDYDLDEEIVEKLEVGRKLPVIIAYNSDNQEKDRIIGEKTKKEYIEFIEKNR